MLRVSTTKKFEKELELARKRGKDLSKFGLVLNKLANNEPLETKHRNHKLSGNFKNLWECHIEPDWLLIYYKDNQEIIFERMGSHSDLFK